MSVEVRKTQHRYVYGRKGQGVQEILQKTGKHRLFLPAKQVIQVAYSSHTCSFDLQ